MPTDADIEFKQKLRVFRGEAAGITWIHLLPDIDELTAHRNVHVFQLRLAAAKACGDSYEAGMLNAARNAAKRYRKSISQRRPLPCPLCHRPVLSLRDVTGLLVMPDTEQPTFCMTSMLCARCAASPDLYERVLGVLRSAWPQARLFHAHEPGHA